MTGHETQALWALAAGELDAAGKARVEAHLAECAACSAEWKRVEEARALLHTARSVEPSVRWEETGAKLKAAAAKRMAVPERRFLSPWAMTLAGACAVALVVWLGGAQWRNAAQGPESAVATKQGAGEAGERTVPGDLKATGQRGATEEAVAAHSEAASTTEAERVTGAVVREATGVEHALAAGMRLRSGMAVRTPPKASAVLRLPDESRVRLSAGSDVVFARADSNAVHLTVQQGRLSVKASHARRDAFLVESAGLRVSVVGTVFSVERTAAGAAVAVLEGRVRVDAEGQPPRFVDAGERVELAGAGETLKPRALSAGDRQAFQDLRADEPSAAVASVVPAKKGPSRVEERPSVATRDTPAAGTSPVENNVAPSQTVAQKAPTAPAPGTSPVTNNTAPSQAVAQKAPTAPAPMENKAAQSQAVAQNAPTAPAPMENNAAQSQAIAQATPDGSAPVENDTAPSQDVARKTPEAPRTAVAQAQVPNTEIPRAVPSPEPTPSDDFAPYPGASAGSLASSSPMPGAVQAPSMAPAPPSEPRKRKTLGGLVPGGLLSDDSDERFLGYAKVQTAGTTCGQFLVGLGEIASASPRTSHREQARILRGRCLTKQHLPADAEDEFRQYLREFPNGHYATEARIALGMSPEPEPGALPRKPAPLPPPVTPRWNGSPQRVPVSPGVPRRW
ncbi:MULTISPECIES: FecR domain-containing protein [unclassified Corallococcus]|uniref:FecR domain-containing protein n=1 Tax=unclassified Corallococcus TaxID=2685029 RepID=UPI001A8EFED2|nr:MULTISPECIES: FecR domain-containing protein [unclassified Corallococcus]MBN9683360.1 FecR domain-containing protein [Corallococcus sp. NCSPR001]WAS85122.1 FecR domain-containing protein [Corallococcus sp. NCRR]